MGRGNAKETRGGGRRRKGEAKREEEEKKKKKKGEKEEEESSRAAQAPQISFSSEIGFFRLTEKKQILTYNFHDELSLGNAESRRYLKNHTKMKLDGILTYLRS